MAKRAQTDGQESPPSKAPVIATAPRPEVVTSIRDYSDSNWSLGVTPGSPPFPPGLPTGVWLNLEASKIAPGDTVIFSLPDGQRDERVVQYAWGPDGAQVFLSGASLLPGYHSQSQVRVRSEGREVEIFQATANVTFQPAPPPEKSLWGSVTGAIGDAADTIARTVDAVYAEAARSPWIQGAAAVATGGLSLAVQAGAEAASGQDGVILGTVKDVAKDPWSVVKKLPGDVLLGTGLAGTVLDGARILGGGVAAAAGQDTALGRVAGAVRTAAGDAQQAARDNPVASLEAAAGVAAAALGIPLGPKIFADAVRRLAGGDSGTPDAAPTQAGGQQDAEALAQAAAERVKILPVGQDAADLSAAQAQQKAAEAKAKLLKVAALGVAVLGVGGIAWAALSGGGK